MRRSERGFEAAIFLSRWLLAPFLIGLFCSLILLIYRFVADSTRWRWSCRACSGTTSLSACST